SGGSSARSWTALDRSIVTRPPPRKSRAGGTAIRGPSDVGKITYVAEFFNARRELLLHRHRVVQREPAAVRIDRLAGDVARLLRGEECRDRGDLVRVRNAAERRAREQAVLCRLVGGNTFQDIGHDRAWPDRVDADAVGRKRERH